MRPPSSDPGLRLGQRRLRLVGGVFALALLVLALRVVDLALRRGDNVIGSPAQASAIDSRHRADIVDRNGTLLATDYPMPSVFADPALVQDREAAATGLARALEGVTRADMLAQLSEPRRFVWLKRHITDAEQRAVIRLGLPGIGFRTESHRIYPQRALAAHLVGYVGVENQALAGIESSFDARLTDPERSQTPLMLTLDLGVQEVVRSELVSARRRVLSPRAPPPSCSTSRPASCWPGSACPTSIPTITRTPRARRCSTASRSAPTSSARCSSCSRSRWRWMPARST